MLSCSQYEYLDFFGVTSFIGHEQKYLEVQIFNPRALLENIIRLTFCVRLQVKIKTVTIYGQCRIKIFAKILYKSKK